MSKRLRYLNFLKIKNVVKLSISNLYHINIVVIKKITEEKKDNPSRVRFMKYRSKVNVKFILCLYSERQTISQSTVRNR